MTNTSSKRACGAGKENMARAHESFNVDGPALAGSHDGNRRLPAVLDEVLA